MIPIEPICDEEKQKQRLLKAAKIFFLFIIIYSLCIALLSISVYFLHDKEWAILTVEQWILSAIILISIAIGLESIFIINFILLKKKQLQQKKQKQPIFLQGKLVQNYTIPINAKGGIFSKTYILIDEKRILNLRYQMISPSDLWEQKP